MPPVSIRDRNVGRGWQERDDSEIDSQVHAPGRVNIAHFSCFSYQHYNRALRSFKAAALGWFVQFAIRGELHRAQEADWELDENEYRALPYLKLRKKSAKLVDLIRKKHIVDEPALAGIGMTLYDFPVLFTFFGAGDCRSYVREPTAVEMSRYVTEMFEMFKDAGSESGSAIPKLSLSEIGTRVKHMTRTQVEDLVGCKQNVSSSTRRLLCVNMAAPVAVLKAQFLDILERSTKQKNEITVMIETWLRYGVLPLMDLRECTALEGTKAISVSKQLKLIYDPDPELARYNREGEELERGPKTLNDTSKPHVAKMLNFQSQPFCALAAAASSELNDALTFARDRDQCSNPEAASEVFRRWIPASYPYNLTSFELAMEIHPDRAPQLQEFVKHLKMSGRLTGSVADRIKNAPSDVGQSWITLRECSEDDGIESHLFEAEDDELDPEDEDDDQLNEEWFMTAISDEWD